MKGKNRLSPIAMAALAGASMGLSSSRPLKIKREIEPLPPELLAKLEEVRYRVEEETIARAKAKRARKSKT